jgi:hypothetical protein
MKTVLISVGLVVSILATPATAEEPGRYQAFPLSKSPADGADKVMIIDTGTGDLWLVADSPAFGGYAAKTSMTYMGKVTPGHAPGETTTFTRSEAPAKKPN